MKLNNEQLKKLHEVELDILIEFDRICRKYNLKYFLCGGTLIGAIRHNGFIPWDDDVDISMPRKDYEQFIEIQKKELNKDKYFLQCIETDKEYMNLAAKLKRKNSLYVEELSNRPIEDQNIFIDIFPVDNIPSDSKKYQLYYFKVYALKLIMEYKAGFIKKVNGSKKNFYLMIIKFLSIFYSKNKLSKKLQKLITKYNSEETKYVASFGGVYLGKEIVEKKLINDFIEVQFENHKFFAPKEYDKYLKHYYGDYMKLPPVEERTLPHYCKEIKFPD